MVQRACRFDADAMEKWERAVTNEVFTKEVLHRLRDQSSVCPTPFSDVQMQKLIEKSMIPHPDIHPRGDLITHLCLCRELLKDTALLLRVPESSDRWFKYIFAKQQPFQLYLQPLELLEETVRFPSSVYTRDLWERSQMEVREFRWTYEIGEYCGEQDFLDVPPDQVSIVPHVAFECSGHMSSRSSAEDLLVFTGPMKRPPRREKVVTAGGGGETTTKRASSASSADTPAWMKNLLGTYRPEQSGQVSPELKETVGVDEAVQGDSDEDCDAAFAEVFHELERRRQELKVREYDMDDCFGLSLLGARAGSKAHKSIHGCRVLAKQSSFVYAFLSFFKLPVTCSFEYNLYSESVACELLDLELWKHRVFFLACCWRDNGSPD
eukprot:533133-Amphidinium_carterae.1